jgi:HK97 family phage portal protein
MKFLPGFLKKSLPTQGGMFSVFGGGEQWKRQERKSYITEGYQLNAIVYRAVSEITKAVADLSVELHQGEGAKETILQKHPVLELLKRPNPMQGYDGFIKECFTNFLLFGEMPIYGSSETRPGELWPISPLEIEVRKGPGRIPSAYIHKVDGFETTMPVDRLTGQSQLFFLKMYNPATIWRGQSPLEAAALAADTHNAGVKWNYKLLKNSARPSGIVEFQSDNVGPETLARLREHFRDNIQGENNSGSIPMLFGGAKWTPTDNNPRDMDFLNTQKEMAKLIASAYGVPLPLIDNDAATFNNMEQAKERFYTDTVIPLFMEFLSQFDAWLLPAYGDNLSLKIDMDAIPALEAARARLFDRTIKAAQAGIITVDEARTAIGYDPMGGAAAMLDPLAGIINAPVTDQRAQDLAALAYGAQTS